MPISTAPYTRRYLHGRGRGHEKTVVCGYCGKMVPRYKTFVKMRGFRISDPTLLQQVDRKYIHMHQEKMYICPSCARHHRIVEIGKSVRKKHLNR